MQHPVSRGVALVGLLVAASAMAMPDDGRHTASEDTKTPREEARASVSSTTQIPHTNQNEKTLTEAEFLSVLDDSHAAVAESATRQDLARARLLGAETLSNPVLELAHEDLEGPQEQLEWTFTWQLPEPSRRHLIDARREQVGAAVARHGQRLAELRSEMRAAHADWSLAVARHDALTALAERARSLAERERLRVGRGESSGLEAGRLELAASGLGARAEAAAARVERARAEAARWSAAATPHVRPVLSPLPALPSDAELGSESAVVRAAELELAAARLQERAARRFVGTPALSLGWQSQDTGLVSRDGAIVGLGWTVPLFDRNQARRAEAVARIEETAARLERTRRRVRAARVGALGAYRQLRQAHQRAAAMLEGTERLLEGAEAAFVNGESSVTDLLDLHRSVLDAELTVLELHGSALDAHRELERALAASRSDTVPGDTGPSDTAPSDTAPSDTARSGAGPADPAPIPHDPESHSQEHLP